MAEKLDIYSDIRVPFDVATWCRGDKHNIAAVGISQSLRQIDRTREQIAALEDRLNSEEKKLAEHIKRAQHRMQERDNALQS